MYRSFCHDLAKKDEVRVVFLDIWKAFSRFWHRGSLFKLSQRGVSGGLLNFFSDYLTDSQQRITIKGLCSDWGHISVGVPQAPMLGPLLFLYTYQRSVKNPKSKCLQMIFVFLLEVKTTNKLKLPLISLATGLNSGLFTFSPPKTETMLVTNKKDRDYILILFFKVKSSKMSTLTNTYVFLICVYVKVTEVTLM